MTDIGDNAQTGDVQSRDRAGRDINYGIPPDALIDLLAEKLGEQEHWRRADTLVREIRGRELDRELDEMRSAIIQLTDKVGDMRRDIVLTGIMLISLLLIVVFGCIYVILLI